MAVEYDKEIERHRTKAAEILKHYFGGKYPPYFDDSLGEQCCRFQLGDALFKHEHGQITKSELIIERQKIFNHIESIRPWNEALFNRPSGQFPEFPEVNKSQLN